MQTPQRLAVDAPDVGWKDIFAMSFVALVSWLGRITWMRIDGKASREEVAALLLSTKAQNAAMLSDMKEQNLESRESRAQIHQKLDLVIANATKTAVDVARLEGAKHALLPPPRE
jgi:hypothetical protein